MQESAIKKKKIITLLKKVFSVTREHLNFNRLAPYDNE